MSILNYEKHKSTMVNILNDIYSDKAVSTVLGFKGGTAAMLFYDLDRFSVDLDFDLLDESKEQLVLDVLHEIVARYGIVKEARIKRYTIFLLVSYGENDTNIKIEISRRSPELKSRYELRNFIGLPMLVMMRSDMFANKLVALTDRVKPVNRDIYDVWFFLKRQWDFNEKLLEDRVGCGTKEYLQKCIKHLQGIDRNLILDGLGELVTEKQKTWIKEHLIDDTIFALKVRREFSS